MCVAGCSSDPLPSPADNNAVNQTTAPNLSGELAALNDAFLQSPSDPNELNAGFVRPVMVDAKVTHVIREDGVCYPADPEYQREHRAEVAVTAYSKTGRLEESHAAAWQYLADAPDAVEAALRSALWAECKKNFDEFMTQLDTDDPECEWDSMKDITDWSHLSSLDRQVYLYQVTILDRSDDDVAHVVFTFDVGWDDEHGLSVVMHKDKVLAVNGAGDFRF